MTVAAMADAGGRTPRHRVRDCLAAAERSLRAAGVAGPRRDAQVLLAAVLGVDRGTLYARDDRVLTDAEAAAFGALVARRRDRVAVSRLLGRREFWSLEFAITDDVLDPRPDSETLVEAALAGLPDRRAALRLLDLGTGSGCLLLALLSELPAAFGVGIDLSLPAVRVAAGNAMALGLAGRAAFAAGDWLSMVAGRFDLIVANPPYIAAGEIDALVPEVAGGDPRLALAGGDDGLAAYRAIAPQAAAALDADGRLVLECGMGQIGAVAAILTAAGFSDLRTYRDLGGVERCITAINRR